MSQSKRLNLARAGAAVLAPACCAALWLAVPAPVRAAAPPPFGANVAAISVDTATRTVWAAAQTGGPSDLVTEMNESDQSVVTSLAVPAGVNSIAADPASGTIWSGSSGTGPGGTQSVTEIIESSNTVRTLDLTKASAGSEIVGIAADQQAGKVFAVLASGILISIPESAPASFSVIATRTAATASAIAVGAGRVWVADHATNTVSAFTENGVPVAGLGGIAVGANPVALTIDPTARTLWVANQGANSVTEIDAATGQVLAHAIEAGSDPVAIAANPAGRAIWAASFTSNGAIAEISEAVTPGRLTGIVGNLLPNPTSVAVDPGTGQVYLAGNDGTSGTVLFLGPQAPGGLRSSAWFSSNNASEDSTGLAVSAFPPARYSMTGAPGWLRLNSATGVLSGVPPVSTHVLTFPVVITATNSVGTDTQPFTLNVGTDPVITSAAFVTFAVRVPGRFQMTAKAIPAATFDLSFGTGLPAGLRLTPAGLLSGTPAPGTAGRYIFGLIAFNPVNPGGVGEVFTLDVIPDRRPAFVSASRLTVRHGRRVSFTIRAFGIPAPRLTFRGRLPRGLRLTPGRPGTARITGTARLPRRRYTITVTASNGIGRPVIQRLVILVR
ncbi:MAG TPA: putative Ig domain-containing protein [Streptosporangiaceae bacterium]|nr:putative Ig domain-containing protein [Streptosporangiaceae bacterium]